MNTVSQYQIDIDRLNQQAATLRYETPHEAVPLAVEALKRSQSGPFAETIYGFGVATSQMSLAYAYNRLGNREKALNYAMDALALYEEDETLTPPSIVFFTLGSIYMALSEYADALTYYYRALDLAHEHEDKQQEASIFNHIGIVHNRMGDYAQSAQANKQALALYRQIGDQIGEAKVYNNQAMAYFTVKAYEEALEQAQQALTLAETIDHVRLTASVNATMGEIYIEMGELDVAEAYLQISLLLARNHKIAYVEMYSQLLLGKMRTQQQRGNDALTFLQTALTLANEISVRQDMALCHEALSEAYRGLGDFEQALVHFKTYHRIQQEIFNEKSDHRLRSLQTIHQTKTARQEAEIYQLRTVALQQEIANREDVEAALQAANDQLQTQNEALDAYAHTVAHDLKQPLAVVSMLADMLLEDGDSFEPKRFNEKIKQMKRSSDHATQIVNELLLLATISNQAVTLRPLDMVKILNDVQSQLDMGEAEMRYDANTWPIALGYAPWIEAVWANYMSNGVKYGGTPPLLELGATMVPNGMVRFWIKDNGAGLSKGDQAKLFVPFNRLHKDGIKGHGLGLSIVRRIIHKLEGEVGVESCVGEGSMFYFTLPMA